MDLEMLKATALALMADDKGLLAMDESTPTCDKRFAARGIPTTADYRRAWRELIVTAPGLGEAISGAILYDETIRQTLSDGRSFVNALGDVGIIPGIKVDESTVELPGHAGEKMTEGLDGLRERLQEYAGMGARFAKWRAVIAIGKNIPSRACIDNNAQTLAIYAALCQECGLVPIVEPEVLMDGDHDLERTLEVTTRTLHTVFNRLYVQGVALEGMVLKPNMVLPGLGARDQSSVERIAETTVECFLREVPAAVSGIAFLSGGQSPELAATRLGAMNAKYRDSLPWALTYSFSRAIQQPALDSWGGKSENVAEAQRLLVYWADRNHAARRGEDNR